MIEEKDLIKAIDSFIDTTIKTNTISNASGWIILLGGKRFRASNGKSIWTKRGYAERAFKDFIEYKAKSKAISVVRQHIDPSIDYYNYYNNESYKTIYNRLVSSFVDCNMLEIKELKETEE